MINAKFIHMLGVNGISMSGLAEILLSRGVRVSGSDLTSSDRTERLVELGASIYKGNSAAHIDADDPPDLLVYTAAAGPDNPERVRARELGIECMDRARLLGDIMASHKVSIGVAGTHGKTTTSAMTASILLAAGADPTINIGGEYGPIGGASRVGGSDIFLAEACEYTDTFLVLRPSVAVITNIEYDHVDYFTGIEHLLESFAQYAAQAGVAVVANADDANTGRVRAQAQLQQQRWVTFAVDDGEDADYVAKDIAFDETGAASFTLASRVCGLSARVRLQVPGQHNIYNGLAAAAASIEAGCPFEAAAQGLNAFQGTKKRFEHKGSAHGFEIEDDYAHHPTEVRTALASARTYARGGKVLCVFHPHTYTRTRAFLHEFAEAFRAADTVLLPDIFPAREDDPGDISSAMLAEEIKRRGGDAAYFPGGFPAIADWIRAHANPGDLVLTMGAGLSSIVADILLCDN
ncbi:MAG: UDP-N-acetylmuramate--L-alanine ligase [Oscillospiraceae bacterium]|nr:UDP-N-acetylmuramate--L-alanine ligase [Oscillospiraceae bacterium]